MMEVELPTTEYYEGLRADMTVRFPKADPFILDHLNCVEQLLDVSTITGFSFSVDKAQPCQTKVVYIGDEVGREGVDNCESRAEAIVEGWQTIDSPTELRQFLGSTNWVKDHAGSTYSSAVKVLTTSLMK